MILEYQRLQVEVILVSKDMLLPQDLLALVFLQLEHMDYKQVKKIRILSDDGDLPENVEENTVYFAIKVSSIEIKLASSKTDADNGEGIVIHKGSKLKIESRVHDKESGDVGSPVFFDTTNNNWCVHVDPDASRLSYFIGTSITDSNSTFIQRKLTQDH